MEGESFPTSSELPSIFLGPSELTRVDKALSMEWLITNGLGGYASSTIIGVNTRKYHGLLVVPNEPPLGRRVLLSKLDEILISPSGWRWRLASNDFISNFDADGLRYLRAFSLWYYPTFYYQADGVSLRKTIMLTKSQNLALMRYELINLRDESVVLEVYPLTCNRGIYTVSDSERDTWIIEQYPLERGFVETFSSHSVYLAMFSDEATYSKLEGFWVKKFRYRTDESRGDSFLDDLFTPGRFTARIEAGQSMVFHIVAWALTRRIESLESTSKIQDIKRTWERELAGRIEVVRLSRELWPGGEWARWVALAADAFIVQGGSERRRSIIAGYYWFGEWGRDTFISLPGLTLVTGRFQDAKEILLAYATHEKNGLIPNFFSEQPSGIINYYSVDTSLWYINAVLQYLKYTGMLSFVRLRILPVLKSIIDNYIKGTEYGIGLDEDNLLHHGPRLTWMDAVVDGIPVTPREGKAVEIQALWYNALKTMALVTEIIGEDKSGYEQMAEEAAKSFEKAFWNTQTGSLFDVIFHNQVDSSIRSNQVLAVSLDYSMLDETKRESVVLFLWRKLWTMYGLRTLSSEDSRYKGSCRGSQHDRDLAYHNGTIWPWLSGPFVKAFLKTKNFEKPWREYAYEYFLQPLMVEQTPRAGLGFISEILDGDPPHMPGGCIAQAWSTAEPLRAYVEDILQKRPHFEDPSTWV